MSASDYRQIIESFEKIIARHAQKNVKQFAEKIVRPYVSSEFKRGSDQNLMDEKVMDNLTSSVNKMNNDLIDNTMKQLYVNLQEIVRSTTNKYAIAETKKIIEEEEPVKEPIQIIGPGEEELVKIEYKVNRDLYIELAKKWSDLKNKMSMHSDMQEEMVLPKSYFLTQNSYKIKKCNEKVLCSCYPFHSKCKKNSKCSCRGLQNEYAIVTIIDSNGKEEHTCRFCLKKKYNYSYE
ncbi:MAG: hypothetical protein Edafosvirus4_38 [Edafosvirus sp.]|uniref:Uncharacterized protein n=1 Tax=Edafosvirus sp. TaxID=2487765 RepID=A0A3G4ZUR2_9VIRU|nr:MAG: hypothetical protein Edafosvirus4_38 [Edafosvirus sp.]